MKKNWLLISRYNEDITWVNKILKNKIINKIIIINKGDTNIPFFHTNKVKILKKNNIGREGETYLSFIIENYYNLPDNIWFTQGNPFEHSPDFLKLLSENIINEYYDKNIQSLTIRWKPNMNIPPSYYLRNNNFYNIKDCSCIDYFIDTKTFQLKGHSYYFDQLFEVNYKKFQKKYNSNHIGEKISEIIGIDIPKNIIKYIWSACFFVKKKNIIRHPISVYLSLRKFLLETDNQGSFQGYILERLWPYLFTGESFNNITECYYNNFIGHNNIISFDNTNRKKISKTFNKYSEIYEDVYSILLLKKENKILSLPGLNILNYTDNEKNLAIILNGNIRDAFENQKLNNFTKYLYKNYKNVEIYLILYKYQQKYNNLKWYYTKNIYTKDIIKNYFELKIKDIQFVTPSGDEKISNFLNLRNNINQILPFYHKVIDLRIDIFGNYFQNNSIINFSLDTIIHKIERSKKNIYMISELNFDDFIVADCNIYKNFLSILKKEVKNNNYNSYSELNEYIYNLVKDI